MAAWAPGRRAANGGTGLCPHYGREEYLPRSPRNYSGYVPQQMKIGIVVHGRFHAFDLARELIRAGHDVCLITNYPKRVAEKFGIPRKSVQSNLLHGIVSRGMQKVDQLLRRQLSEPFTHRWFGAWSAKVVAQKHFDVVHGFSGVFEETLRISNSGALKTLVRGSAHIETQYELL